MGLKIEDLKKGDLMINENKLVMMIIEVTEFAVICKKADGEEFHGVKTLHVRHEYVEKYWRAYNG